MAAPAKEISREIQVPEHICGSTQIKAHAIIIKLPSGVNKKETKTTKSKKKKEQKHSVFAKVKADCKETKQLVETLHAEYISALFNSFKK